MAAIMLSLQNYQGWKMAAKNLGFFRFFKKALKNPKV